MLKKKNIAMAMAAVTVATPVAIAFAAPVERAVVDSTQEQEIKDLKAKVAEIFKEEYTSNKNLLQNPSISGNSVFEVIIGRQLEMVL